VDKENSKPDLEGAPKGTPKSRSKRRSGGSAARRVLRSSRSTEEAVQTGMLGGAYKPLSERDIRRIPRALRERIDDDLRTILDGYRPEPSPEFLKNELGEIMERYRDAVPPG